MCGICGIVDFTSTPVSREEVKAMNRTQLHRGPDAQGIYFDNNVGLGHTRLSILDLSDAGKQPMLSSDGKVILVFNGEIYNFREIRNDLEKCGVKFRSHSDTEVLLHAYLLWGKDSFLRLNGMFAFAIWDARVEELILVRDRHGIKPLYWHSNNSGLTFGSEIKSILARGRIPKKINYKGLHEYFYYGNCLGNKTLFKDIQKLRPGYFISLNKERIKIEKYWDPCNLNSNEATENAAIEGVRDRLDKAIHRQLVSDVPVGVFLSGGIDSSCITAYASRYYGSGLQTFSVGFDFDKGANELPKAKEIAKLFGTDHNELHVEGYQLPEVIEQLVRSHDEPFGDAADIPLFLLCQQLNGAPKVILQGDGGDEIFAGYRRYKLLSAERTLRAMARTIIPLHNILPKNKQYYKRARMLEALKQQDPALRMALLLTQETLTEPPTRLLSKEWQESIIEHDPFEEYRIQNERFKHLDAVQKMLYVDTQIILPNTFLEKVDKSTMAHSMEIRVPLLDNELVDYVSQLPSSYKIKFGKKKYILRKALRGVIPDKILDAPKTGFEVPYSYWLQGPLCDYMKSVLFDESITKLGIFNNRELRRCVDLHVSGQRQFGYLLWKMLNLALWLKMYEPET